jgi:hypothetical protein
MVNRGACASRVCQTHMSYKALLTAPLTCAIDCCSTSGGTCLLDQRPRDEQQQSTQQVMHGATVVSRCLVRAHHDNIWLPPPPVCAQQGPYSSENRMQGCCYNSTLSFFKVIQQAMDGARQQLPPTVQVQVEPGAGRRGAPPGQGPCQAAISLQVRYAKVSPPSPRKLSRCTTGPHSNEDSMLGPCQAAVSLPAECHMHCCICSLSGPCVSQEIETNAAAHAALPPAVRRWQADSPLQHVGAHL